MSPSDQDEVTQRLGRVPLEVGGVRMDFITGSVPLAMEVGERFAVYLGEGESDEAYFTRKDAGSEAIDRFFLEYCPDILLKHGGLLLQAAGIAVGGKGYVFLGPKGAGKSTVVALISDADPEAVVLGDDSVIVRMERSGSLVLHAMPVGISYSRLAAPRVQVPVAGIFILDQSDVVALEEVSSAEAVDALLSNGVGRFTEEADAVRFEWAVRFSRVSPGIRRLKFRRDAGFWDLILGRTTDGRSYESNEQLRL